MNTNDATRANAEAMPAETRDVGEAIDLLNKALDLNELVFMAGESLCRSLPHAGSAITAGSDVIDKTLNEAKSVLDAFFAATDRQEGGAA